MGPADDDRTPEPQARQLLAAHRANPAWAARLAGELARQRSAVALAALIDAWDLTRDEAARLFGVAPTTLARWGRAGVPAARARTLAALTAAQGLLARHLRPERIPVVLRRPCAHAQGHTLLELTTAGPAQLRAQVRAMFAWGAVPA